METQGKVAPDTEFDHLEGKHAPWWMTVVLILGLPYMVIGVLWMNAHANSLEMLTPFGAIDYLARIFLWPLYMIGLIPS